MWRDPEFAATLDKGFAVVAFVGTDRDAFALDALVRGPEASISVPSTLKCSSLANLSHWALSLTRSKKVRASFSLNMRSRLALKVEGSQTLSSMFRPTNHRYSRL